MEIKEFKTVGSEEKQKPTARMVPKTRRKHVKGRKSERKEKSGIGLQAKLKNILARVNKAYIFLGGYILCAVLTVVLGIAVFRIPVVTAVLALFIEAGIAACLHNLPIWLHGIVLVAEVILGIVVSQIIFMVLLVLCYIFAIFSLKYLGEYLNGDNLMKKGETI